MIFASFGNAPAAQSFNRMAEALEILAENVDEPIYAQTGNTIFEFHKVRTVKFLDHTTMLETMTNASLVILQGGWGTISEAIMLGKKIVSIPRKLGQECKHPQEEVVRFLEKEGCLLGCYDTANLGRIVEKARHYDFKPLKRGSAEQIVNQFIESL